MNIDQIESLVYNYSINIIGFNMTLIKANLNNKVTSEIVFHAGELNTLVMDAFEMDDSELNEQMSKCIQIAQTIQSRLSLLDLFDQYENEKTNLEIDTANILKALEKFIAENV